MAVSAGSTEPAPPLALFSLGNLVIGTGAFILAGILADISADLRVGVPAVGQAMTAYALSTAVLAPLLLVLTLLYLTATFTMFGYIGPVLQALGPMTLGQVSFALLAVGVSGVIGTLIGGWATDRFGPARTLTMQLTVFTLAQIAVPFTSGSFFGVVLALLVWGIAGFGMMAPQRARLAAASPANAPLLLSLNTSMLYFGTALGSIVGGAASSQLGFGHLAWAGVPFQLLGLLTLVVVRKKR